MTWREQPILKEFNRIGVFMNWNLPRDEQLRFAREKCGFDDLVIGVPTRNNMSPVWNPVWTHQRIAERIQAVKDAGMLPVVMVWAVRQKVWLDEAVPWLTEVGRSCKVPVLLDCEPDKNKPCWHRGTVGERDAADMMQEAFGLEGEPVPWGVTGLDRLHKSVIPIGASCNFHVPQAYSIWKPVTVGTHWSHNSHTFPGVQQRKAWESWTMSGARHPAAFTDLVMGLSCYWGKRPATGSTPAMEVPLTMRIAVAESVALGVSRVWYWALEQSMKKTKEGEEVREFFGANR